MAEKLCELRKKGGGGGKYTETSLWTNSAPTSSFSAQTVTLSDSIDNYKYIKIRYAYSTSYNSSQYQYEDIRTVETFKKGVYPVVNYTPMVGLNVYATSYTSRMVMYASSTSVRFGTANNVGATGSSDNRAIPLEILGLNELDHGTKYTTNASEIAFKSVSANTIPTFTTVAEAKAIWLTINYASAYKALQITNVNPTTGEINNDSLYKIDTNSLGNIEPLTGNKFIVTSNSVTMQNAPSTAATQQSLIYTY